MPKLHTPQRPRVNPRLPVEVRLWGRVDAGVMADPSVCWPYLGSRTPRGYGEICVHGGQRVKTHRLSYTLCYGPIPKGLFVCHRCDNPPCVNPFHLFLGTAQVNADDCVSKGRSRTGERNTRAVLTEARVAAIRNLLDCGVRPRLIADACGVTATLIRKIRDREVWKGQLNAEA